MARVQLTFPDTTLFQCALPLRISDINYGQHLGHDTLVTLLHEGRCQWLASHGLGEGNIEGTAQVVAELVVNYLGEAFYPEQLNMELAVGEMGRKGVEVFQRLSRQDGQPVAIAKVGIVFFNTAERCAVAVPEAFKALL
ncbi:MAG: acyl-CoA thioesterase [Pseudomonadota bacterium]|uniref:acyl-CoA thioesterase n=1 Tax=Gallaecimonas pentaromativorans TaxID=584787 RepID=UPI00067F118A|nr:acyl-CoA thioesterase [Gallaecimonas pentaromativorans]MED5525498.1 acyl-CoA thioesterase [Pseudomonadota bacterium]